MQYAQASMIGGSQAASAATGAVVRVRTCTYTRLPVPETNAVCVSPEGLMVAPAASIQRALIADGYYERNALLLARIKEQAHLVAALQIETATKAKQAQQDALQEAEELLSGLVLLSCVRSRGTVQVQWADGVTLEAVVLDVDAASGVAVLLPVGDPVFRWWDGISGLLGLDRATVRWVSPARRSERADLTAGDVDASARKLAERLAASRSGPPGGTGSPGGAVGSWHRVVSEAASELPSPVYGSDSPMSARGLVATAFAWLREHALSDSRSDEVRPSTTGNDSHLEANGDTERLGSLVEAAPWMCPRSGGFAHVPLGLGAPGGASGGSDSVRVGEPISEISLTPLTMHAESSSVLKETSVALSMGRAVGVGPSGLVPRRPMLHRATPARETSVAQAVTAVGSDPTTASTHKAGSIATAQGGPSTSIRPRPWEGRFFGDGVLDSHCTGAGAVSGLALPLDGEAAAELDFRLGRYPTVADSRAYAEPAQGSGAAGDAILRRHLPQGWWDEALRDAASLRWCSLETDLQAGPNADLEVSSLAGLFASDATCPSLSTVAHAARAARLQQSKQRRPERNGESNADRPPSVSPFRGALIPEQSTVARQMHMPGWRRLDSRWLQQTARAELASSPSSEDTSAAKRVLAEAELSENVPHLAGLRLGPSPPWAVSPSQRSQLRGEPPFHADTRILRVESSALAGCPGSAVLDATGELAGMVVAGAPGLRDCVERSELRKALCRATSSPTELVRALNGGQSALKSSAPRQGSVFGLEAVVPLGMARSSEWSGAGREMPSTPQPRVQSQAASAIPDSALVVAAVTAGSVAERAGVRVGDCILSAGGRAIGSSQQLRWAESEAVGNKGTGTLPLELLQGCVRLDQKPVTTRVVLEDERQ